MNKHGILSAAVSFFSLAACAPAPTDYYSRIDDDDRYVACRPVKITGRRIPINSCDQRVPQDKSDVLWMISYGGENSGGIAGGGGGSGAEGTCGGTRE